MIVECQSCQTRFQLDEGRIPPQGIRVRCSRCKEAFFLKHPSAGQSEGVDQVAEEAASGGGIAAPDATQDLTEESRVRASRTSPSMSSPGLPAGVDGSSFSGTEFEEAEESDWEFIDDQPAEGGSGENRTAEDDPIGSEESDSNDAGVELGSNVPGSVFSVEDFEERAPSEETSSKREAGTPTSEAFEVPAQARSPVAGTAEKGAAPAREAVFGSVDDFSSLAGEEPGSTQEPEVPEAQDKVAAAPGPSSEGELGDPEEWDFFSGESLEQVGSAASELEATPTQDSISDLQWPSATLVGPRLDGSPVVRPTSKTGAVVARAGRAAGWTVTLGLLCVGLARGLLLELRPGVTVPTAVDLKGFRAEEISSQWVETSRAGVLYTVTGRLRNTSSRAATPGARLQVSLLSAAGDRLESPAVAAGIPMKEAELRELPLERLRALQEQASWSLSVTQIGAGDTVPFLAVLNEVPDEAERFLLELQPAEASPGGNPLPLSGESAESALAPSPSPEAPSSEIQEGQEQG